MPSGRCLLMLRPERLQILDGAAPPDINVLRGVVHDAVYQGDSFLLRALLADGSLVGMRGISTTRRHDFAAEAGRGGGARPRRGGHDSDRG